MDGPKCSKIPRKMWFFSANKPKVQVNGVIKHMANHFGIVVATDEKLEWLLPWWWALYSKYNSYPVAFVDFGMSPEKRRWCAERGVVVPLGEQKVLVAKPEEVSKRRTLLWEKNYSQKVWDVRGAWFQKPLAFGLSPFETSLWLDLDCEVSAHLEPMISTFSPSAEIALVRDQRRKYARVRHYNSGVVLYRRENRFLQPWAQLCSTENGEYMGDEDLLSKVLQKEKEIVQELPPACNWMMFQGVNPGALIYHWGGVWGKEYIRRFGGIHTMMEVL